MTSNQKKTCVIVGASHAGVACAQKLRRQGWQGRIKLIGDEVDLPYPRPPLSKDYLKGTKEKHGILLSSAAKYEKDDIDLTLGVRVERIDRDHQIETTAGDRVRYDKMVLATGAKARELPFAPRDLSGVFYLRDLSDIDQIRVAVKRSRHAVIIGGGYIGLEAAATLRSLGLDVTVLEAMERVLQRVTSEPVSSFFARVHREEGVDLRENCQVSGLVGNNGVEAVALSTGEEIKADVVIIGIGVAPNTRLAENAGLVVDNGICVNKFTQTSDAEIYAIGDCANVSHARYARRMRLESVQNANDQALTAAKSLCGNPEPYEALPWFWSDQFDVKLQIAGLAEGYDKIIVRGDPLSGRSMSVFYLHKNKLISVDALNSPRDFVHGKKLILSGVELNANLLLDPEISLLDTVIAG